MLVLTRKIGQSIQIPEYGAIIRVLSIQNGRVRLGITAPAEVRILRGELLEQSPQGTKSAPEAPAEPGGLGGQTPLLSKVEEPMAMAME